MIKVKYVGIDDWNRPVFKDINKDRFYCSLNQLFEYGETESSVLSCIGENDLCFKGYSFNCEPYGDPVRGIVILKGDKKCQKN